MPLTKNSVTRSATFFQIDFDPKYPDRVRPDIPELYRNRLLLAFTIDYLPKENLAQFTDWMNEKWNEIPSAGQHAFFNNLCAFLRTETVILGESGLHIANKVRLKNPYFYDAFLSAKYAQILK